MTKIEEVARAICETHGYRSPYIDTTWHKYIPHARAAIKAMRGPSEKMIDAVYDADLDINFGYYADGQPSGAEDVFNIMIDTALEDDL